MTAKRPRHLRLAPHVLRVLLAVWLLLCQTSAATAWGPHTQITRAALAVIPLQQQWQQLFGDEWDRIARDYCWMADWRLAVRPDHYADDYLLFPGMEAHLNHMLPEVRQTYLPYFRRALQAVRTENPQNAARWIGSLLHFVQDSGSPPHTIGLGGVLHTKMENWLDAAQIDISGYQPQLLGETDDAAEQGFLRRMDELIAYSKARAERLLPILEQLDERVDQPLELESALETSRVTADIVHTLITLGNRPPAEPGCDLTGRIQFAAHADYAAVPPKVMLADTTFSTTADAAGRFQFRNLPAGRYTLLILATGHKLHRADDIHLSPQQAVTLDVTLRADPQAGNLVRNASFELSWITSQQPDWWHADSAQRGRQCSALIRVPRDRRCHLQVQFHDGRSAAVAVRWRTNPAVASSGREIAVPEAESGVLSLPVPAAADLEPFERNLLFLEIVIASDRPLRDVCRHVAVTLLDDASNGEN